MMELDCDEGRIRAYREAARGYLAVHYALGFPTLLLDDEPRGRSIFRVRPGEQSGWRTLPGCVVNQRLGEVLLAPTVAEAIVRGSDRQEDDPEFVRAVRYLTADTERHTTRHTAAAVIGAWEAVRQILTDGWDTVEALTELLVERGRIEAEDLWSLLKPEHRQTLPVTAHYYAGRTVAALLLGCQPWYVSLLPNGDASGCMEYSIDEDLVAEDVGRFVDLAGAYATARYLSGRGGGDLNTLFQDSARRERRIEAGRPLGVSRSLIREMRDAMELNWYIVEGMASELLRNYALTEDQVLGTFLYLCRIDYGAAVLDEPVFEETYEM